jgi:hypothetical protein
VPVPGARVGVGVVPLTRSVGVGGVSAPLADATEGCDWGGRGAVAFSVGTLEEEELVCVGADEDLFLFLEARIPPATPPAMAPMRRIPPTSMKILHFF